MRNKNMRVVYTGIVLVVAAIGFFFYMSGMAPRSNDPKALMEIIGQVSGVVVGIGVVMIAFGLIGKKTP